MGHGKGLIIAWGSVQPENAHLAVLTSTASCWLVMSTRDLQNVSVLAKGRHDSGEHAAIGRAGGGVQHMPFALMFIAHIGYAS